MTDHIFLDFWNNRKLIWKLSKNDFIREKGVIKAFRK